MAGLFKRGLIHVYFGDGQGKTSAAVGLAARVSGCGGRVLFAQFLKTGKSGELKALKRLEGVEVIEAKPCLKFVRDMDERERAEAAGAQQSVFREARDKAMSGGYDLLVFDEVIDAIDLELIGKDDLLSLLSRKPECLEIALTGHRAFPELLEAADYVSEIKKVRHPYDNGVRARRGAEF